MKTLRNECQSLQDQLEKEIDSHTKERDAYAKFLDSYKADIRKAEAELWSTKRTHNNRLNALIETRYESLRQQIDEVIRNRMMFVNNFVSMFIYKLIRFPETVEKETYRVYRDVAAQMESFIEGHPEPARIEMSGSRMEYPIEDLRICRITIPAVVLHFAIRDTQLKQLKECDEQTTTKTTNRNA